MTVRGPGTREGARPSALLADEDRGAGHQPAAQRAPGTPGAGVARPATPARPGRPARSPAARDLAHPVAERCGGARRSSPSPSGPARRTASGRSRSAAPPGPPRPGSSGKAHRSGWVTENTQRPPGRSTRATSRITAAESATNGTPPYAEQARSKTRPRTAARGVGLHQRQRRARRRRRARGRAAACRREVQRDRLGARRPAATGRTGAAPAADLEHPPAGDVAEQPRVGLGQAFRSPDEAGVAEEGPVLIEVGVGLGVPPGAVGPHRLGLPDLPPADAGRTVG